MRLTYITHTRKIYFANRSVRSSTWYHRRFLVDEEERLDKTHTAIRSIVWDTVGVRVCALLDGNQETPLLTFRRVTETRARARARESARLWIRASESAEAKFVVARREDVSDRHRRRLPPRQLHACSESVRE